MLIPTPPDRLELIQAGLREQIVAVEPDVKNIGPTIGLVGDVLEFPAGSGHFYCIPPTPYTVGLRLQALMRDIRDLRARKTTDQATLDALEEKQRQAVAWFKRLSRPVNLFARAGWLLPWVNPFAACSDFEVSQLLVFFYAWTTRSRVQFFTVEREERPAR